MNIEQHYVKKTVHLECNNCNPGKFTHLTCILMYLKYVFMYLMCILKHLMYILMHAMSIFTKIAVAILVDVPLEGNVSIHCDRNY